MEFCHCWGNARGQAFPRMCRLHWYCFYWKCHCHWHWSCNGHSNNQVSTNWNLAITPHIPQQYQLIFFTVMNWKDWVVPRTIWPRSRLEKSYSNASVFVICVIVEPPTSIIWLPSQVKAQRLKSQPWLIAIGKWPGALLVMIKEMFPIFLIAINVNTEVFSVNLTNRP